MKEIEFRLAEVGAATASRVEAVLRTRDAAATARLDPATGIVHAETVLEALEAYDLLQEAGLSPAAPTG